MLTQVGIHAFPSTDKDVDGGPSPAMMVKAVTPTGQHQGGWCKIRKIW
ncbi:hypothetical protein [Rhodopila sp.]